VYAAADPIMQSDPSGLGLLGYGETLTTEEVPAAAELPELSDFSRVALALVVWVVESATGEALSAQEIAWVAWGLAALEAFQADLAAARAIDQRHHSTAATRRQHGGEWWERHGWERGSQRWWRRDRGQWRRRGERGWLRSFAVCYRDGTTGCERTTRAVHCWTRCGGKSAIWQFSGMENWPCVRFLDRVTRSRGTAGRQSH
jgi:hypothetical protein